MDYDREAELALQRLTTGDVDVNQLTNAWTRSYVEVITHFSVQLLCLKTIIRGFNNYYMLIVHALISIVYL